MSRKNKYSTEDKLRAASLTNSGMTAKQVADVLRVEVPVAVYLSYVGRKINGTLKKDKAFTPRPAGKHPHAHRSSWDTVPKNGSNTSAFLHSEQANVAERFVENNVEPKPSKPHFWSMFWWVVLLFVISYSIFNSILVW